MRKDLCAYCECAGTMEELSAHILVCSKHPMAALKAENARLREALKNAADAVSSEYCSHGGTACGPSVKTCYVAEYLQALEGK